MLVGGKNISFFGMNSNMGINICVPGGKECPTIDKYNVIGGSKFTFLLFEIGPVIVFNIKLSLFFWLYFSPKVKYDLSKVCFLFDLFSKLLSGNSIF